ncbi:SCO family protein, partial [Leptospira bandrabouensis]|uniref:SCO family protein n=1 Tax=Leptospira bandrabouensis TaxID=2484903 RepID=UPI001EE79277
MIFRISLIAGIVFCSFSTSLFTYDPDARVDKNEKPKELEGVGVKERLGKQLDLSLLFRDETGKQVPFGSFFKKDKPVLLSLVYYKCPTLCNFHLNGITDTLKKLNWQVGNEFEYVAVSFDPKETAELAQAKKNAYIKEYSRGDGRGWHFLT